MSNQWLYQIFALSGYRLVKVTPDEGRALIQVEPQPHRVCCPKCGSKEVIRKGAETRWLRNLPVGSEMSWVILEIPRVHCAYCNLTRQIHLGLAEPRRSYTRAFERYVLELLQYMVIQDVVRHLAISWDMVKDIQKRHLKRHYSKPALKDVTRIAIDEICIGRSYRFVTLVLDLDTGAILYVGEGKKAASLRKFWVRVRAAHAKIKAVAMDMSKAYRAAVEKNLPKAAIVFDHFHVVKLMNSKLTKLRRDLYRQATDDLRRKNVLKGTRWLLLKNPENLDPVKGEPKRLQEALKLNEALSIAYYLKEDLRQIWRQASKEIARLKLLDWYHQALSSGVAVLHEFARTLLEHQHGILAWYDHPISSGPMEGTNNKIKTMIRQHFGLRDYEFFVLKLYQLHKTRYALVG